MQALNDLVHLPFSADLTEGGVAFAVRSLSHMFDRVGEISFNRLRRIVAGAAVDLAFRRYLSAQNIPFEIKAILSFAEPDRYDVYLGGRRCDLKSFFISRKDQTYQIRAHPEILLDAPALVPSDQHAADGHAYKDLYLFAFSSGSVSSSHIDTAKAIESGAGHYLIHVFPETWRNPQAWNPLVPLTLKTESNEALLVELSGRDETGGFKTHTVHLPPKKKVEVEEKFYSLSSIHINQIPRGRLGIHCPAFKDAYIVLPENWGNIWTYGMDIYLTGWLTREEFSQKAKTVYENTRVFQYDRTKNRNLAVSVSALKPFAALLGKH